MSGHLQNILYICGKHFIFKPVFANGAESVALKYNCGPVGELFRNNIHQEWFMSNVVNAEENLLPFTPPEVGDRFEATTDAFVYGKELCCGKLPFGICHSKVESSPESGSVFSKLGEGCGYFHPLERTSLRTYFFTHPAKSALAFSSWQRQRKAWWRKFSRSPGRYTLTDVKSIADGDLVMVNGEYPWGEESLEAICLRGMKPFEKMDYQTRTQFEVRGDRRGSILPHVIESVTTLDAAMLAFVCDAYEERPVPSKGCTNTSDVYLRLTLHLHRRLAPFKASFSAFSTSASVAEDLSDLASYLTRQLRRAGISILLSPDLIRKSMEVQHLRNDEIGIPYTIVMNDSTLKSGLVGLRSRDTSLKEQLHITDLKSYMRRLLKNY